MAHFMILNLPTFADERGYLTVLEKSLPFNVARTYWIYSADGQIRGGHRHLKTRQALIAMNGKIDVYMNDGITQETIQLYRPDQCLIVEPKDWHTMSFHENSVLFVMASHQYDRNEYIDTPYELTNK